MGGGRGVPSKFPAYNQFLVCTSFARASNVTRVMYVIQGYHITEATLSKKLTSNAVYSTISVLIYESLVPQPAVSHWISVLWSVVRWLLCGVDVASDALWFIRNYLLVIVEAKLWRHFVKYWPRLNQLPPPLDPLCNDFEAVTKNCECQCLPTKSTTQQGETRFSELIFTFFEG